VPLVLAWIGIAAISLGRDLMGDRLHHYVGGYSVIVWVMLLLFALSIAWSQFSFNRLSDRRAPYSTNGPGSPWPSD
jgi:hypothetical protein